ncbi:MAG: protein kinase [Candidatus Korobacteraceae bacterium]
MAQQALGQDSLVGQTLGHYRLVEKIGAGGMGEVFRAHDALLQRDVAIKILPAASVCDPAAKARLLREACTASQLNHPNICTIYEVGEAEGRTFLVMELIVGEPLSRKLRNGPIAADLVLHYGLQLAEALAHAHQHHIIHRDLKSSNIMITPEHRVKILDFGLAKQQEQADLEAVTKSQLSLTRPGAIIGTLGYMSPEQLRGRPADARSDVWALGVVLYEMASNSLPFRGKTEFEIVSATLNQQPVPSPSSIPEGLRAIMDGCLQKQPERRYQSATEVRMALEDLQPRAMLPWLSSSYTFVRRRWLAASHWIAAHGRRRVLVAACALVVLIVALSFWQLRAAKVRWARKQLPQIEQLAENNRFFAAYQLAITAERYIPGDPELQKLWSRIATTADVTTEPEGADLYLSSYSGNENVSLGRSPLRRVRVPRLLPRWKIEKSGYGPVEGLFAETSDVIHIKLDRVGETSPGMVRVAGGLFVLEMPHLGPQAPVQLPDYWIDKYEVTNRDFKKFVDAGGYSDPKYWKYPFVNDGRQLSFSQAMESFRDRTGRPGPAIWEAGTYLEGRADYPVTGVSWYEAAAYAEFVGKSLPTIFHWGRSAGLDETSMIVPQSNFDGKGLAPVGQYRGISDVGAYDMAGNAKEWVFNANGEKRFILGGAWDEPGYQFSGPDAQSPLSRRDNFGFRLVQSSTSADASLTRALEYPFRDFTKEKPVGDAAFAVIRGLYSYDKSPLRASVDSVDDSDEYWRKEKVSFDASYGGERVTTYVFLPRHTRAPYQTIVYFPGSTGIDLRSSSQLQPPLDGAMVKSGRAFVFPVYKGTYERGDTLHTDYPTETVLYREHVFAWYKDLARTLDYIQTRPDLDGSRIAYFGFSWGARLGPLFLAVEPRLKTAILLSGGLKFARTFPELDPFNFASRVKVPVLMVNVRYDFYFPLETSQLPLFHLLGTPEQDKRHVVLEGTHGTPPLAPVAEEVLSWLDRYLGPVRNL